MPRIPAHFLDIAPHGSKDIAATMKRLMGKLLNIHAAMAHSPVVIGAYDGISRCPLVTLLVRQRLPSGLNRTAVPGLRFLRPGPGPVQQERTQCGQVPGNSPGTARLSD